jgi:predicted acylesterase/phospholipase RssA/CRP-like cAMP-binding protein
VEHLRNLSIFRAASDELLQEVSGHLVRRTVERGAVVCRQGQPGGTLYFIRSGQVRVTIQVLDDDEETLGFLGSGDHFGEMSVITGELISANVTATTRTELEGLDGETFHNLCEKYPLLYREISKTLSKRLLESNLKRLSTRLGKVTRFIAGCEKADETTLYAAMTSLAEGFHRETGKRPLLIVPLQEGRIDDEAFLQSLGLIPEDLSVERGWNESATQDRVKGFKRVSLLLDNEAHRWYRLGGRWNLLAWKGARGKDPGAAFKKLDELLFQLKPIYAQILVSQIAWTLDTLLEDRLPDDNIACLFDLTRGDSQVAATPYDYVRLVPEGLRYGRSPEKDFWVLRGDCLAALEELAADLGRKGEQAENFKVVLLHKQSRPVLDFSRVRGLFPHFPVHTILVDTTGAADEPVEVEFPSTAIALGRMPSRAKGKVVRDLAGRQVGLALGGGGARGLAHIGVIRTLEEEGVPVDLIAGSSIGAVVAGAYAEGRPAKRLVDDMRLHFGSLGNFLFDVFDYTFPRTNLLRGRKIRRMIETAMKDATIETCQIPLFVVCTDLITGQEIVLEEGSLGNAIRASGSLPGIFKPVWWGEHLIVDGAVLNKVPARVLKQKGANVVLAVNVTPDRDTNLLPDEDPTSPVKKLLARIPPFRGWRAHPNILRILSRSLSVSGLHQSRVHSEAIDVEIKPKIEHFDFLRFDQYDEIVEAGAEAAREALPEIRRVIERSR